MLLKVVKNPISRYLPAGARCYGMSVMRSYSCHISFLGFSHKGELRNAHRLASTMPKDVPIVLVFGAMASGSITTEDHPYVSPGFSALDTGSCKLLSLDYGNDIHI